jgi:hypothetical protein
MYYTHLLVAEIWQVTVKVEMRVRGDRAYFETISHHIP